ncbi:MAG: peroxidase [Vicinamibacterales bacterium]
MTSLRLDDIQGFILRSYLMPALRVFVLSVVDPARARASLAAMVGSEPGVPQITTAAQWSDKPEYCVNVAITYEGLEALQVPQASLQTFPSEFVEGAVSRADRVGDSGTSAPSAWKGGLDGSGVHLLLMVFGQDEAARERVTQYWRARFGESGLAERFCQDADALPGNLAHFGYRDGFSQPTIDGGLPALIPDRLPPAPPGEFLLGHLSQFDDFTYPVPQPDDLGRNGSFMAFRILEQDCAAFERFLADAPDRYGISGELLAAKICGRWRNGVPLSLSPDTDTPDLPIELEQMASFDFVPTPANPEAFDDRKGIRCPIGSHIRRMNPRHATVAGGGGLKHRIVRRGLPYGPPFDPSRPDDGIERGLVGLFIGVSLKDQFEFLMKDWVNKGDFAPGISGTRDAIIGVNADGDNRFVIPRSGERPIVVTGFPQFVRTRGAAYGFLPSITGIRHLAAG